MTHWAKLNFFPEEFILLQKEIQHHPVLIERLGNHASEEFEIKLAEVATYCDVILDGDYDQDSLVKLAGILEKKLYNMRPPESSSGIILLN